MAPAADKKCKLARQLYPGLPTAEMALLSGAWATAVLYALYRCYLLSEENRAYFSEYELTPGWFGWMRDTMDHEWETFSSHMAVSLPWMVLQLVGTQLLKKYNHHLLPIFNCVLSIIYFWKNFDFNMMLSMVIQPVLYFAAYLTKMKSMVWVVSLGTLLSLTASKGPFYQLMRGLIDGDEYSDKVYLAHVTWAWINARGLSFCMDKLDGVTRHAENEEPPSVMDEFIDLIGYVLYIPPAISGPIVVYRKYHKGMKASYRPWTRQRVTNFCLQGLRYGWWFFVANFALHWSYHASLRFSFHIVEKQDMWTLAGVALANSSFFHLKYVVFYGIPRVFAVEDGIEDFPKHPACIFRIHLYRDMWRLFDVGLYEFIVLYIYVPFMKIWSDSKLILMKFLSSSIAFAYIYVWHGIQPVIMLWSIFNFISVSLETLGEVISNTARYQHFEEANFSKTNIRRIRGFIITPLLLFSICGNFYFLAGKKIGYRCVQMAVSSWPLGTPILLLIVYCGVQFSIRVKNDSIKKQMDDMKAL